MEIAVCDDEQYITDYMGDLLLKISIMNQIDLKIDKYNDGSELVKIFNEGTRYDIIYLDIVMEHMNGLEVAKEIRELNKHTIIIFVSYFESWKRKIKIISINGEKLFYGRLHDIEVEFNESMAQFLRVHQSFLVNFRYIESISYTSLTLENGKEITISEERRKEVGEKYNSWVKFTLPKDIKMYARCSYDSDYEGMSITTGNSNGMILDDKVSPNNVINPTSIIPFLVGHIDNETNSTQTYYVQVDRNPGYDCNMCFTISLNDRIKSDQGTFIFSGTATNPGNPNMLLEDVESSVLTLNLTNNSAIPPNAIVKRVTTKGTMSPSQGNVRHMILPASTRVPWYTATVNSATSGSYTISKSDDFEAKQIWQFKYNAKEQPQR